MQKYKSLWCKLTNKVNQHIPLPTIIGRVGEQKLDQSTIYWLISLGCLYKAVQKVIAAFHLRKTDSKRETRNEKG